MKAATIIILALVFLGIYSTQKTKAADSEVIISEFFPNPKAVSDSEGEWIELYNCSDSELILEELVLRNQTKEFRFNENISIGAKEFLVICREADSKKNGGILCDYEYTSIGLINSGGFLELKDINGLLFRIEYTSEMVKEGKSMEIIDPDAKNPNQQTNWAISDSKLPSGDFASPGFLTDFKNMTNPPENDNNEGISEAQSPLTKPQPIIITEILTNPEGVDGKENEFIEVYNPNSIDVNLQNYFLSNKKEDDFEIRSALIIKPYQYYVFYRKDFNFSLYNSDEKIRISYQGLEKNNLLSELSFSGSAPSGQSYNRDPNTGVEFWSKEPTPGQEDDRDSTKTENENKYKSIKELKKLREIKNKSLIEVKGIITTPEGFLKNGEFYLQAGNMGILIKPPTGFSFDRLDTVIAKGEIHKTKTQDYLKVEKIEDLELSKNKKKLNRKQMFEIKNFKDHLGGLVVFTAQKPDDFYVVNNEKVDLYTPQVTRLAYGSMEKDLEYSFEGIVLKDRLGYKIMLTKYFRTKKQEKENHSPEILNLAGGQNKSYNDLLKSSNKAVIIKKRTDVLIDFKQKETAEKKRNFIEKLKEKGKGLLIYLVKN